MWWKIHQISVFLMYLLLEIIVLLAGVHFVLNIGVCDVFRSVTAEVKLIPHE